MPLRTESVMKSCLFAGPGELPRAGQGLLYSAGGPTDGLLRSGIACVSYPPTWRNTQALSSTGPTTSPLDKARAVSAVYDLIGECSARANARRVMNLVEAMAKGQPDQCLAGPER